ncbi:hypothetical protein E1B28_003257 [Marasmius oreades]|uniref:Protein kinase domain-containing protein n=1 Tax=Marasmius oreades TaxID=181124 RepID=A0A9P7UKB4_9AGAR|nr:uncharacterized protein E1B28_003257 [Marasmius oreades]KAG7085713.1 hypothetical protein E1B28_003257 [Marasmius oreades]
MAYRLWYQFGAGGKTISDAFPFSIDPDATIDSLFPDITTRISTWGQDRFDSFVGARPPSGMIKLYKMPDNGLLGFDPVGCSPLQRHIQFSCYWPSAPERNTVHILAYFHSETQQALTAAPNVTMEESELTFKLLLRWAGDTAHPQWKTFSPSNEDECEEVVHGNLPSSINDVLELPRKPHSCSKQTVGELYEQVHGAFKIADVLKEVLSDDAEAEDYFPGNKEISHLFSALGTMHDLEKRRDMTSHIVGTILFDSFVNHWGRWIPDGRHSMKQPLPLSFLLYAYEEGANAIYRYTFKPDWACLAGLLPRLLVEFDSSADHDDECRLLIQLLCTFKFAHHHVPDDKKNKFFLMGLFITKQWCAHRWVVYKKEGQKIILQKKAYYLKDLRELASLLCVLYNYSYHVKNDGPIVKVQDINQLARKVDQKYPEVPRTKTTKKRKVDGDGSGQDSDGQGSGHQVCKTIETTLLDSGYVMGGEIKKGVFRVLRKGTPFIAKLGHTDEISFLRHLSSTESLQKHTLDLFDTLESRLGQLIILPMHSCLDKIDIVNTPLQGRSIQFCRQLVDGAAFLHKHHIAHLDLKPSNIVYDFKAQRLSIIDFDVAVWCNDVEVKVKVCWGTEGWTAPEVVLDESQEVRAVNPIRVDLWSCGRVLKWIDQFSRPNENDVNLTRLSLLLMNDRPEYRPSIHEMINEDPGFWCSDRLTHALDSHCDNISRMQSLESMSRSCEKRGRRTEDQTLDSKRRRTDEDEGLFKTRFFPQIDSITSSSSSGSSLGRPATPIDSALSFDSITKSQNTSQQGERKREEDKHDFVHLSRC